MSKVRVINKSSSEVVKGSIEIAGQKFIISNLNVGEESIFKYKVFSDSGYLVQIEFVSGKRQNKSIGYITHGFIFNDKLIITDEDIIYESTIKRHK